MWTKYLASATFAYNTFNIPNLGNYSPYELTFCRNPKLLLNTEANMDIKVSRNLRHTMTFSIKGSSIYKTYYLILNHGDWQ